MAPWRSAFSEMSCQMTSCQVPLGPSGRAGCRFSMSYSLQVSSSIQSMYPARIPRSALYPQVSLLSSLPYSFLQAVWSFSHSSGMNVFQDRVTSGMPYPSTMSKNILRCSRLGLSSSRLSQLQKTYAISTSRLPSSF